MFTRPILVTAPADVVVTTAEAKAEARIDHTDDDTRVARLVSAATAMFDGWSGVLGRCLVNQTWQAAWIDWPAGSWLRLPFPDVSSVTLTYYDTAGTEQTVSSGDYAIVETKTGSWLRLSDSFTSPALESDRAAPVVVQMVAGYGAAGSDVPESIRAAILMTVADWFDGETAQGLSPAALALVAPHRRQWL